MCSVFKTLAAAAVLRDLDRHGEVLARRIHYTEADLVMPGSDQTRQHLAEGMTIAELAEVAITYSDNTAGNLLLRELGGPTAITRFARSLGDRVTRLDRWEPELNTAEPWRITDTTSPYAIGRTYGRLVLGDALNRRDRELLTHWLLNNTTSVNRFHAGLPKTWTIADKTGSGSYGTANDVGVAWTDGRRPDRPGRAVDHARARTPYGTTPWSPTRPRWSPDTLARAQNRRTYRRCHGVSTARRS